MSEPFLARLAGRRPLVWAAVFALGLLLTGWLERSGRIAWPWNAVLVAGFALSLVLLRRSSVTHAALRGNDTPALRAYNRRALVWALSYIVLLGLALTARNTWHPQGPALWLLALLPSLPIAYYVWSLWRYVAEETDEYQRMRQIQPALIATGVLLVVATVWGFLETFDVAPHAEGWWAVAVWAAGMGLGNVLQRLHDRRDPS
jgi:hypothetical protein